MADRAGDHVFEQVRNIEQTNESYREVLPALFTVLDRAEAVCKYWEGGASKSQLKALVESLRVAVRDAKRPSPDLGELLEEAETRRSSTAA